MIDIKFLRENPDAVKENIKKKFQDSKLGLVDEVIALDAESRAVKQQADDLRANRNKISKQIGMLMGQGKKEEAMAIKEEVTKQAQLLAELEQKEAELSAKVTEIMMRIPQIIDPSVPIGKDDSENVEIERFGEPFVPEFEVPYHTDIMEKLNGIDLDSARKVAGNGFYYLMGDIAQRGYFLRARLHDRPRLYLLRTAVYDPLKRRNRRYELCRDGFDDVQDRGRGSLSDRYLRALDDRQVHRHDQSRGNPSSDTHQLLTLLPQGKGRSRH